MNRALAIIPARKGSKRVPNKNIKEFHGKPLVAWSIDAAQRCNLDMDVVVSTDSQEIADISIAHGAEVPFLRPAEFSSDTSPTFDALKFSIDELIKMGRYYDYLVLLQPTSPLRQPWHIDGAFGVMLKNHARTVISVCEIEHPVEWTLTLPEDNCIDSYIQESFDNFQKRGQDFPKRYRMNGAVSCSPMEAFYECTGTIGLEGNYAYIMDKKYSYDINDIYDFEMAELQMKKILEASD